MKIRLTMRRAALAQYLARDRTWARDGLSVMPAQALRDLLVRFSIFQLVDTLRQAGSSFRIDVDALLRTIVFDTDEGPATSRPWPQAPTGYELRDVDSSGAGKSVILMQFSISFESQHN